MVTAVQNRIIRSKQLALSSIGFSRCFSQLLGKSFFVGRTH